MKFGDVNWRNGMGEEEKASSLVLKNVKGMTGKQGEKETF